MKFLRKFNEVIDNEIVEDVRDILLELQDEGFHIEQFSGDPAAGINYVSIKKENLTLSQLITRNKSFIYGDIESVMERLRDYLGSNLFKAEAAIEGAEY